MTYELATWIIGITVAVMVALVAVFVVMLKVELARTARRRKKATE